MKKSSGFLFVLICAFPALVWADGLQDPTRPPAEIGSGIEGAVTVQTANTATKKGLLSVIISQNNCAAIIDGKTIRLGEKYGNATLVEITANGVVLQQGKARRSMELFPKVDIKVTALQPAQEAVKCKLENVQFDNRKSGVTLPGQKEKK